MARLDSVRGRRVGRWSGGGAGGTFGLRGKCFLHWWVEVSFDGFGVKSNVVVLMVVFADLTFFLFLTRKYWICLYLFY